MTDIGEMVSVGLIAGDEDECPFPHNKRKVQPRENVFPPKDGKKSNNAKTLAKNMTEEYHFTEMIDITVNNVDEKAKYSAHHLIPGNGSWPKTELKKWVDKRFDHIKENIGYDVNRLENGVSLPGWKGVEYGTFGGAWGDYNFQREYAIAAMNAVAAPRQFHDSHTTYSEFVVKVLDKINAKLDARVKETGTPGCGDEKCSAGKKKKYNPPLGLNGRIDAVAVRLERHLVSSPKKWKMPLFTSKWGLAYKRDITEKEASKLLSKAGKSM